jgi:histidinol-phosphate aminotransferase
MSRPPFTPIIEALPALVPFIGPEAMERARGQAFQARLGANENVFGPSPRALAIMREAVNSNWMYSDPENYELRSAIAKFHDVSIDNVVVGEGIDGLLGLTCQLFIVPGDRVVMTQGSYPTFNFHVLAHGGKVVGCPMLDFKEDLLGMAQVARDTRAKLIYVSNPNSPMGTCWTGAELARWISDLPKGALLILDEAYCDTAPVGTSPMMDTSNAQVVHYRTFSKAYGMAGARIGYAIAHVELIAAFDKVRNHYGINRIGQLGARAALEDQSYLSSVVQKIDRARIRISQIATDHGLRPLPSAASFVAIDCGLDGEFAKRVLDGLILRDVFARKPSVTPLDRFIRVSCGRDEDLEVFEKSLSAALADARSR